MPTLHLVFWIALVASVCIFALAGALLNRYWLHRNAKTFCTTHAMATRHNSINAQRRTY